MKEIKQSSRKNFDLFINLKTSIFSKTFHFLDEKLLAKQSILLTRKRDY